MCSKHYYYYYCYASMHNHVPTHATTRDTLTLTYIQTWMGR